MKKFILCLFVCSILPVNGAEIRYGYNAQGQYVPVQVGNERVKYGYNAYGE